MQKITYYCDKCGKVIKTNRFRLEIIEVGTDATVNTYDLHPECKDEIAALMNAPDLEEEEEPKQRTKIDRGKVIALHAAGWKVKDIAGEMHLKETQVSQVIYQEKKKQEEKE